MTPGKIHIVVTCGKRKSATPLPRLQMRRFKHLQLADRAKAWVAELAASEARCVKAEELYIGEQWAALRSATSMRSGMRLWILSAGYGLVPAKALLAPYSATFSRPHPDSVLGSSKTADDPADWWEALCTSYGLATEQKRLSDLKLGSADRMLIAASPVYLRAVRRDLATISATIPPGAVTVFAAGAAQARWPFPVVRYDGRLRQALGGSLMSLNVRALLHVLRNSEDPTAPNAQDVLAALTSGLPPLPRISRRPAEDAEISGFIRAAMNEDPTVGWSRLLRSFRDHQNRACEQKRFRALFRAATANGDLPK